METVLLGRVAERVAAAVAFIYSSASSFLFLGGLGGVGWGGGLEGGELEVGDIVHRYESRLPFFIVISLSV